MLRFKTAMKAADILFLSPRMFSTATMEDASHHKLTTQLQADPNVTLY